MVRVLIDMKFYEPHMFHINDDLDIESDEFIEELMVQMEEFYPTIEEFIAKYEISPGEFELLWTHYMM